MQYIQKPNKWKVKKKNLLKLYNTYFQELHKDKRHPRVDLNNVLASENISVLVAKLTEKSK